MCCNLLEMSIDLEWDKLDASLASSFVGALNRQLARTTRPSFIGPVEVTSLDFGTVSPDVELVDLRDVYRDFLEDDDGAEDRTVARTHRRAGGARSAQRHGDGPHETEMRGSAADCRTSATVLTTT